jgi:hypothetical protein
MLLSLLYVALRVILRLGQSGDERDAKSRSSSFGIR